MRLIILIGSQKGLCGIFNTALINQFEKYMKSDPHKKYEIIGIGKKIVDFLHDHYRKHTIKSFQEFNQRNMFDIAKLITEYIMLHEYPYSEIIILSNEFTGFFIQRPRITHLIPFEQQNHQTKTDTTTEELVWEHEPDAILNALAYQYIQVRLQYLLFESLLAEHAARFVSMDNSTRNAEKLLETTLMDYNKLRQAKITKELTELTGGFQ